jgi:SAM-dependent methyltransferase
MTSKNDVAQASPYEDWYFRKSYLREWPQFWSRLSLRPDILRGKRVLELGCGYGAFCIRSAEEGASTVTGLDLDERRIEACRHFLFSEYDGLSSIVDFRSEPIKSLSGEQFDVVISNETLEHVLDLPSAVDAVEDLLVPGGVFIAGWGPLWPSPFGGHSYMWKVLGVKVPWSHLFAPGLTRWSFRRYWDGVDWDGPREAGLNALSIEEYRMLFERSGLIVDTWEENSDGGIRYAVMRFLAGFSPTRKYFTSTVYAVMHRRDLP